MRRLSAPGIAVLVWAGAACAGGERDGPIGGAWGGSVVDSAGVTVVHNPAAGSWRDDEAWTLTEELRIGSFGADPDYQFAQIGSIVPNSRGEILVMDRQVRKLSFYSEAGEFIRAVGTPGQGPGEFGRGVTDVFVGPGDTLLVPDPRNRRVHRLGPEGELLGSEPLDLERYRPLRFRGSATTGRAAVQLRPAGVLVADDAATLDQLALLEPSGAVGMTLLQVRAGQLLGPEITRYFTPEPAWTLSDSLTVIHALNSEYRISWYDRDGVARRIVTLPWEPRRIGDRDIRAFFAYLDRAWLSAGVPPSRLEENHRRVSFAETFPAFSTFYVGKEGSLWVQPVRAPGDMTDQEIERYNFIEDFGSSDWDVFGADGRYQGVVSMPPRFQPRWFVGDFIYGVQRDELDVQFVVRLRVVPGP